MTQNKLLKILATAIKDWETALNLSKVNQNYDPATHSGLCHYFLCKANIINFPAKYLSDFKPKSSGDGQWFTYNTVEGYEGRLQILRQAIIKYHSLTVLQKIKLYFL